MPFITDAQLKTALAGMLRTDEVSLPALWTGIITDSNNAAYLDIRGLILARGFTSAQADSWDRGAEFQRDLGLYWCLVKGAGLHNFDDRFVVRLDRRKELTGGPPDELPPALIELGGLPQNPAANPNAVLSGSLNTENDRYKMDDVW